MALELSLGSQIYLASSSGAVWIDDAEEGRKEGRGEGIRRREKAWPLYVCRHPRFR